MSHISYFLGNVSKDDAFVLVIKCLTHLTKFQQNFIDRLLCVRHLLLEAEMPQHCLTLSYVTSSKGVNK